MKHASFRTLLAAGALALTLGSTPALAARHDKDQKEALYPNATRKAPKLDLTSAREQKTVNEGLQAAGNGDKAKATELLQPIIDSSHSSQYAKAMALQGLAMMHYKEGDLKDAIDLLSKALDNGVLPNDTYFQLEYDLAQFYAADGQYQKALDTLNEWRAQGKKETAASYGLEGNIDYQLEKYPEAIAAIQKAKSLTDKPEPSWDQILLASYSATGQADKASALAQQQVQANPNDPEAVRNAASALVQAQDYPKAIDLMEKARAAGNLDGKLYVTLAKLHLITGQNSADDPQPEARKAAAVLEEGLNKGVVEKNYDNQKLLGDAYYVAQDEDKAIAAYRKAVPMATDGDAALRAGELLIGKKQFTGARDMIRQAIAKGVKHQGNAYMMLAEAERGLKNKAAAVAAMKKAAQDPETAAKARAWLKQAGVK